MPKGIYIRTEEHRKNLSELKIGKRNNRYGIHLSKDIRLKISLAQRGEKGNNWKGGYNIYEKIRKYFEYREWRSDIYKRDNYTCQKCGERGFRLNAHHIKPFSKIVDEYKIKTIEIALECNELWDLNNGITLCKKCHIDIHKKKC